MVLSAEQLAGLELGWPLQERPAEGAQAVLVGWPHGFGPHQPDGRCLSVALRRRWRKGGLVRVPAPGPGLLVSGDVGAGAGPPWTETGTHHGQCTTPCKSCHHGVLPHSFSPLSGVFSAHQLARLENPLDFYMWNELKRGLDDYSSLLDLRAAAARRHENIVDTQLHVIGGVGRAWHRRLRRCVAAGGGHFEGE